MSKARTKKNLGICRLCNKNCNLIKSHIIPKFIFKWQKESSATGQIRMGSNPNKRVQDGIKTHLLCIECEQRFNEWETKFASIAFHPLVEGKCNKISYDFWLLKFSVSLSWRILIYSLENSGLSHLSEKHLANIKQTEIVWKEFLLGMQPHPKNNEQHLIYLGYIDSFNDVSMPKNINRYLLRATDFEIVTSTDLSFTYVKFGCFCILGFIEMQPKQWVGSKIHVKHGVIGATKYPPPVQLREYIKTRAQECQKINGQLTERQCKIINESYKKDMDRAAKSETIKAMTQDVVLFGEKAVFNSKYKKSP